LCACGARSGLLSPNDAAPHAREDVRADLPAIDLPQPAVDLLPDAPPDAAVDAPPAKTAIFAHSSQQLYRVDPDTLVLALVGNFGWPAGPSFSMTDLAIDAKGLMVGLSYARLWKVDAKSAACTLLTTLGGSGFNALSFVPAPTGGEHLVAATASGEVHRIDTASGAVTYLGSYQGGFGSSGDIVSVTGVGTVATAFKGSTAAGDWLIELDPATGFATSIGQTGFNGIWGLSYWKGKLYGFTSSGHLLLLDAVTGKGTLVKKVSVGWWGAAVTTAAPTS
jgi:hypothetical protein